MNRYPDNETYKNLYARFYNGRTAQELLKLAYPIRGTTVLDLCGGEGRLGLKAVQGGARFVWLVDKEKSMVNVPILPRMDVIISSVEEFLGQWQCGDQDMHYDRVLCQQAVNYWLDASYAAIVAKLLNPGGIFVFNTFYKKPSEEPTVKKYGLGDKKFVEVSWLVRDTVHHVQIREGLPSHATSFQWLSPARLIEILTPHFEVDIKVEGNSSLYRCIKAA